MTAGPPRSLAEIRFYVTRAAVGAGAPFGIGEEVAEATVRLASKGRMDWVALSEALDALGSGGSVPPSDGTDSLVSAVIAGPMMAWSSTGWRPDGAMDCPDLAEDIASALRSEEEPVPPAGGVTPDAAAWETVQKWFNQCLVPSSAESRLSGAGAGLVDKD